MTLELWGGRGPCVAVDLAHMFLCKPFRFYTPGVCRCQISITVGHKPENKWARGSLRFWGPPAGGDLPFAPLDPLSVLLHSAFCTGLNPITAGTISRACWLRGGLSQWERPQRLRGREGSEVGAIIPPSSWCGGCCVL